MAARFSILILLAGCASTREAPTPPHFWMEADAPCESPTAAALGLRAYTRAEWYRFVFAGVCIEDQAGESWSADRANEAFDVPPESEACLDLQEGDRDWTLLQSRVSCGTQRMDSRGFCSDVIVRLAAMGAGIPKWTFHVRAQTNHHRLLVSFLKKKGVREVTIAGRLMSIDEIRWRTLEDFEARFGPIVVSSNGTRGGALCFRVSSSDLDAWLQIVDELLAEWK